MCRWTGDRTRRLLISACTLWTLACAARAANPQTEGTAGARLRLRAGDVSIGDIAPAGAADAIVLQLRAGLTPELGEQLRDAGVELLDYLPPRAYLARADAAGRAALARMPEVARVGAYAASWRACPQVRMLCAKVIQPAAHADTLRQYRARIGPERAALLDLGRVRLAVTSLAGETQADLGVRLSAQPGWLVLGGTTAGGRAVLDVEAPAGALDALAAVPGVQFVEDAPFAVPRSATTAPLLQSGTPSQTPFWSAGLNGAGQIVGLIDTPPRVTHCMFADAIPPGPEHRKFALVYPNPLPSPALHGTMVAGIIAGDAGTVGACDSGDGLACAARLAFADLAQVNAAPTGLYDLLRAAHDAGAAIHTNSWGDDGSTAYTAWCHLIDAFSYAYEHDAVIFAATNLAALRTPENAKNALAVAAAYKHPNQASRCYGGAGPTADGRRKPEVFSPGCGIVSAANSATCNTQTGSGTSYAAPAVAAAMALARQYFVDGYYPNGSAGAGPALVPSGALLRALVLNGAADMAGVPGYPSDAEGWGLVGLHRVLHLSGGSRRLIVRDVLNTDGLLTGESDRLRFGVWSIDEPLRVTLVFTDPPGAVGSADPVVNNLDLVVTAVDGSRFLGNVFADGRSVAGGTGDARNTVEQVHFDDPPIGEYSIEIAATEVNGLAPQGYAVVITGAVVEIPATPGLAFGDYDGDGDRDLRDFAAFQGCFTESNETDANPACASFDVNGDGTIDARDHAALNFVHGGPGE